MGIFKRKKVAVLLEEAQKAAALLEEAQMARAFIALMRRWPHSWCVPVTTKRSECFDSQNQICDKCKAILCTFEGLGVVNPVRGIPTTTPF